MPGRRRSHRRSDVDPDRGLFDGGVQQERTSMAWERTAVGLLAVGAGIGRSARVSELPHIEVAAALLSLGSGALLLVWSGVHYESLHDVLRSGESPVHPKAAALVGAVVLTVSALALGGGIASVVL
jgi:uncharacterized membrane protein YidH (DUF202 family)